MRGSQDSLIIVSLQNRKNWQLNPSFGEFDSLRFLFLLISWYVILIFTYGLRFILKRYNIESKKEYNISYLSWNMLPSTPLFFYQKASWRIGRQNRVGVASCCFFSGNLTPSPYPWKRNFSYPFCRDSD